MEQEKDLTEQLKKLNQQLGELKTSGRHMIYSANPFKFAFFNFLAGVFHTLGTLFGYIVIFGVIAYLFSQMNLSRIMSGWVEKTLQQIQWERIMPAPNIPNLPKNLDLNNLQLPGELENLEKQLKL